MFCHWGEHNVLGGGTNGKDPELDLVVDSLDDNKAAGTGEISIRLIKSCKLAVGVHLQFALNECITEKVFPTKVKLAYVTPIFKM